jgi:hypothetical protein
MFTKIIHYIFENIQDNSEKNHDLKIITEIIH